MRSPQWLRFDKFELRLDSGELYRGGVPVALQPQPARVLELLASRSGELVGREEIRQLVWGESFVDFDASLNFCIKQIRRALDDSATSPRYIETVPRRGYRFLRPVQAGPEPEPDIVQEPIRELAPAPLHRRWPRLAGALFILAAMVLLVFLIASRFESTAPNRRLVIFPLTCQSAEPADRQVCGGVTEALTAEITRRFPNDLEVIASTSPLVYQKTGESPQRVARKLGATHLVTGTVASQGERLRITARLATAGGRDLWHTSFESELMDAPSLYGQIARKLAGALKLPLSSETAETAVKPSKEATEAYLRGIYLLGQWKFDEAVKSLEEAVLLAPRFAPAYAALAMARTDQGRPPQEDAPASLAAARQALQLDPRLPEAHLAMANVLFKDLVDWGRAGAEFRQALVLNPGRADSLHAYASYLAALGRYDEAIAYVNRARELDPASMGVRSDVAWFLYLARRYDEAIRQARSTLTLLEMTRGSLPAVAQYGQSWAYHVLVYGSLKKGDDQTVLDTVKEKMRALGQGEAAARIGSVPELLEWRRQFILKALQGKPGNSYGLAAVSSSVGRVDEALGFLEQACRNGGEGMMFNYVAVEPVFDPLRGDPRFARIVDCTRLPRDAPAWKDVGLKPRATPPYPPASARGGRVRTPGGTPP